MPEPEMEAIRHALTIARERGYAEVEVEFGELEFEASLCPQPKQAPQMTSAIALETGDYPESEGGVPIVAPMVGYYRAGSLEVGARVRKGDIVAAIAALGLANDIEAPADGEVDEVLVEPNQPVEYGQVLARLKPE
jgi:biotin carboxyl carrier protein